MKANKKWLLAFFLMAGAFTMVTMYHVAKRPKHVRYRVFTIATAKNFYAASLSHLFDKSVKWSHGKKMVTVEGPPNFQVDPNIIISGGPMMVEGENITFNAPFIFRYKDRDFFVVLHPDGELSEYIGTPAGQDDFERLQRLYRLKNKIGQNASSADLKDKEIDFVINILGNGDLTWMRVEAAKILGAIKSPKAIEPLLDSFRNEPRHEALPEVQKALLAMSNPQVVEAIIAIAEDTQIDSGNRKAAIAVLGQIKDPKAVEPLIALLEEKGICAYAALALAEIKDPRAIQPLIAASTYCKKPWAPNWMDPRALEPLISRLRDPNWVIRRNAAVGLGNLKDPSGVEPLIAKLGDTDPQVRLAVVDALGNIKDPRSCLHLYEALINNTGDIRSAAARALAGMEDEPIALELLQKALKDNRPEVTLAAEQALRNRAQRIVHPTGPKHVDSDVVPRPTRIRQWEQWMLAPKPLHPDDVPRPAGRPHTIHPTAPNRLNPDEVHREAARPQPIGPNSEK